VSIATSPTATDILSPIRHRAAVISNRQVATDTWWLELDSPEIAGRAEWGQFVMIGFGLDHLAPPFLPRPFSVGWRAEDGRIGLLVRAFGAGSRRLAELRAGERVLLLGPLGPSSWAHSADRSGSSREAASSAWREASVSRRSSSWWETPAVRDSRWICSTAS
jgi:hypothetical protein